VGHNRMAGLIYFMLFLAFFLQCLTGFGLYAAMSDWWLPKLFAWVPFVFGGDLMLRTIHHWTMWFFILFIVVHVYLVFYHDYVEGSGEISSMGGGWKFVNKDHLPEDEKNPATKHGK
jgi:Ni/Fe-hydrogenase 1 B-type cytochrome subunit